MKLMYRGVAYEYTHPTLEITEGEIAGKYRGQPWQRHYLKHIPVPQPTMNLMYRGVAYSKNQLGAGEKQNLVQTTTSQAVAVAKADVVPLIRNRYRLSAELSKVHHMNVQRILEHRLEVARSQGNASLVKMLEAEREYI
ncbi:hypothetical protein DO97_04230 [Neosynechococcus sphagnicola sy1]|uniref:DUF4278 domain-containing protein n=1 Tax=Neosynechococcus sphagnicola sy1 TaxID=1497020 RepID=A0A098TM19_9CYAN|nr:DUF4278 domain-containing protein [Neosynechococcus sphagnicola]KGF72912.1 hypothetical protein DO97_04230 [Neosynechococcus sphagnicola sy1]